MADTVKGGAKVIDFPDLDPRNKAASKRDLMGEERGTQFDWGQRLFAYYGAGDVFDYGEWGSRDMKVMFERDGTCSAIEKVLTLPVREADFSIEPGKGDSGECDFARSVLMTPDTEGGMHTPMYELIGQVTSAQIFRRAFFEKTFKVRDDDSKIVYHKVAYRPPATCQARYNDRNGIPNGFRQQVWLFGGNLMMAKHQKVPGYVDIPKIRSYIYTHNKHREPLTGASEMEVPYWALAYNSSVQTPDGPVRIQDIRPGDYVFGANGSPTKVLAVHPQGVRQMYRVTFRDGASVECDADHLWGVHDSQRGRRYRVMSTRALMDAGLRRTTAHPAWRFRVPRCGPAEYPERSLPLDPYVLGAWLGDGSMQRAADGVRRLGPRLACSSHGQWIAGEVARRLEPDMKLVPTGGDFLICPVTAYDSNPVRDALVALGVNKTSPERFIPEIYMQASVKQRLDLLRGLMDTDGSNEGGGNHCRYYTKSPQLARDVQLLVRSLGGTAIYRQQGDRTPRVELFTEECPFLMPAKSDQWNRGPRSQRTAIVSIEPTTEQECCCITVEADDGLFLTDNYVVTHNCYQTSMKLLYMWYHFLENQALPRLIVYGNDQTEASVKADDVASLKSSGVVGLVHPLEGQKTFDVLESGGDGGKFFADAMNFLESWKVHSVLAGFMALTGGATGGRGSYALSQDQSSFYLKSRQAVAKEIAGSLTQDIVRPLVMLNFGSGATFPAAKFGPLQDEQVQALLTMFQTMAAAPSLNVPVPVFDLITERMASILQLDVDQVHQALVSTASQRAEKLAANPPPGMPPEAAGSLGQLQGLASAAHGIATAAQGRPGAPPMRPPPAAGARAGAPVPPSKPPSVPPPGRMA